jgi:hypothetical protein
MIADHQEKKERVLAHFDNKKRRSEERNFALNFNQIRNMISKQTKLGEMIRHKSHVVK